jgi:hypothetical protein
MYAKLDKTKLEKLRKLEKELGVVLVAYQNERGYVLSAAESTGNSH